MGEGAGDPSPPRGRPPGGRAPAQSPGVRALAGLWEQEHHGARITPRRRQDFPHCPFPTSRSRFLFSGWKMDDFIICGSQQSIWEFGHFPFRSLLSITFNHWSPSRSQALGRAAVPDLTVLLFRGCGEGPGIERGRARQGGPHGRWAGATKASTEAREQPMKGGYRRDPREAWPHCQENPSWEGGDRTQKRKEIARVLCQGSVADFNSR